MQCIHIVAAGGNPHVMVLLLEYGDSGKLMRDGLSIQGWKDISLLESSVGELGNYINGRRLLNILFLIIFLTACILNDQLVTSKH